jgi:hypothetical protein
MFNVMAPGKLDLNDITLGQANSTSVPSDQKSKQLTSLSLYNHCRYHITTPFIAKIKSPFLAKTLWLQKSLV